MNKTLDSLKHIKDVESAKECLFQLCGKNKGIKEALLFAKKAHQEQYRKSGEPYIIHPILVAVIVKLIGGDDEMVISALLHDTVEDTDVTIEDIENKFGKNIKSIVDGLTKITEIREEELLSSSSNKKLISSALTFRKMLISSIEDVRVLVIKLCDRVHNMLTLDALSKQKQKRITEETLVVYVPIAHRLGIGKIKNFLEDRCFYYLFPKKYQEITNYIESHLQDLQLKLNNFITEVKNHMLKNGFVDGSFEIQSRIKHKYSIYQKMQRKGVSIEEVLDLLALRVLVYNPLDCYQVLGIVHQNYRPLIARFKDYIAIPKDNAYQTLHTTVFHKSRIFELQIRTFDMHKTAEYGIASHWKYKGHEGLSPNLSWLSELKDDSQRNNELDELILATEKGLYSEDISVFSPKGDLFTLPRGAIILDFAYAVHSEVGLYAKEAYLNKKRVPFLTELKNGDMVKIVTSDKPNLRCSWINSVKTSHARSIMVQNCKVKRKELDSKIAKNILLSEFNIKEKNLDKVLKREDLEKNLHKCTTNKNFLQTTITKIRRSLIKNRKIIPIISPLKSFKLQKKIFDKFVIYSTNNYSKLSFDFCCHPKQGDEIVAIIYKNEIVVHHKFCSHAQKLINQKEKAIFIKWGEMKNSQYKLIVSIENKKGTLAKFLQYLAKIEIDLLNINLSKSEDSLMAYFEIIVEIPKDRDDAKGKILNKKSEYYKIIDFYPLDDAYKI